MCRGDAQRLFGIEREQNSIPLPLKDLPSRDNDFGLIIDQENGLHEG
jgi:hypothetical protein